MELPGIARIDSYVVRTTLLAFALVLGTLTGVIWITQALRGIDLMTSQGQTILVFLGVTGLAIPLLALIIAPIALVIAVTHALNKLATDSEIIVMNAAGLSPWGLLRPFLSAALVVGLLVAFLSVYVAPESLRNLRRWTTQIGADVLANVLQPGQFIDLGKLTIRVQERAPGGLLMGIFVDDKRNPGERVNILADRGTVHKNERGSFLVLEDGNLQRFESGKRDPVLVAFKTYAFDMSQFSNRSQDVSYNARERFIGELISPPPDDPAFKSAPAEFRVELHDRLFAPIYPFVFVLIAFAFLGPPRTTRQSKSFAIGMLLLSVLVVRIGGYACSAVALSFPPAIIVQYVLLAVASAASLWLIWSGRTIDVPTSLAGRITMLRDRLFARWRARRFS